ncbi:MAG: TonB-dependent receptor plug domain-containing protein [Bacteroidales bacterium]|jgi:TonB-dependent SusC/RagA subfamily outer membrane receptor
MRLKTFFLIILASIFSCSLLSAQKNSRKIVISGYVTDAMHNPVQGAMILIDKKNTNVVTDNRGFYKVRAKTGSGILTVFSFTGGTSEASIQGRTSINFTLAGVQKNSQDKSGKNESVDIGYGTTKRKDVNTQVTQINNKSDDRYASYSNIYDMLRGAVPGVQVIGKSITVQGVSSGNSNSEPLFVVDGVVVSSIDDIQPIEVRSVEVLKGPSASIYGSRGQNGVLLIHLKGTSGK